MGEGANGRMGVWQRHDKTGAPIEPRFQRCPLFLIDSQGFVRPWPDYPKSPFRGYSA
jgi:hypothetical protein